MTEQAKHTPEPWTADTNYTHRKFIPLKTERAVTTIMGTQPGDGDIAYLANWQDDDAEPCHNASRIVACVNALEGIADPAALREQRDELLRELGSAAAEMEQVLGFCVRVGGPLGPKETHSIKRRIDSARAAIAKATR